MKRNHSAELGLLLCALFWGASGVVTQLALTDLTPMGLIFLRFLLASVLGICLFKVDVFSQSRKTYKDSLILSILLMIIYITSTYGLQYTTASNAGFILGSSVILVPIFNSFIYKNKSTNKDKFSSILCFIGLGFVTLKGASGLNIGDFYCFLDAIAYSFYIIYNSRLDNDVAMKPMVTLQYTFVTLFALAYLVAFETLPQTGSTSVIASVIILGFLCTFLAFFIQLIAQKHTSAERASRILTFIPIFSVIFDVLVFKVKLTPFSIFGGILVILATIVIDIDLSKSKFIGRSRTAKSS